MGDRRNRRSSGSSEGATGRSPVKMEQLLDGFLDRFTRVDDILRDVDRNIDRLDSNVEQLDSNVRSLVEAFDEQTDLSVDVTQSPPAERPYDFSREVPADTPENDPETETWTIPHDGTVTKVVIGWPDGAQQAVGVGLRGTQGEALIPAGPKGERYLAFNDKVLTFNLDDTVAKDDTYEIRYASTDENQDHFVNVVPILQRD